MSLRQWFLLPCLLWLVTITVSRADSIPGTELRNRADISWLDSATGLINRTRSNASSAIVGSVHAFLLEPNIDTIAHAGKFINLPHRIYNTGNSSDSYRISVSDLDDDDGLLLSLRVIHDRNGNGKADPGEPELEQTPILAPGDIIEILLVGSVPAEALEGHRYDMQLRVEALSGAVASQQVSDTVVVADGAFLSINKTSDHSCNASLLAGDSIAYRLDFTNSGNLLPTARMIDIEGVFSAGVLLADEIPSGTLFDTPDSLSYAPVQGIPLLRLIGDDSRWTRPENWNGSDSVREVGLFLPAAHLAPGQSGHLAFSVETLQANIAGRLIENQASMDFDADGVPEFASNTVCNRVSTDPVELGAATPATLQFIQPAGHLRRSGETPSIDNESDFVETGMLRLDNGLRDYDLMRDGLYIELQAADLDPTAFINDGRQGAYIVVTLRSTGTGDSLQVVLLETAPGSGIYRTIRPIRLSTSDNGNGRFCPGGSNLPAAPEPDFTIASPECVLNSMPDDTLQVTFDDSAFGISLTDTVVIDPIATVFDAYDLSPVPDTRIIIRQMSGPVASQQDSIARDPNSDEPLVMISDEQGRYSVPPLEPGSLYYIQVEPPATHGFPSAVPASQFISYAVTSSSYGTAGQAGTGSGSGSGSGSGVFTALADEPTPLHDIPLDPANRGIRLVVEKRALQTTAEPGDVVAYSLSVRNQTEQTQYNVIVEDQLPYGFKLLEETLTLDGQAVSELQRTSTSHWQLSLGNLQAGEERVLSYVLEVTAGAIDGDGINTAQASARTESGVQLFSAESLARVRLTRTGVLSDRATLFGKVYIDADCNHLQNNGEWPVGGVKLYLDDGTFAISDENGQYSLYGLSPGAHVIRIDPLTVPEDLVFKPLDNANAANGESRFVNLSSGDFHRADFAAFCPQRNMNRVFERIRERNAAIDGSWLLGQAQRFDQSAANDLEGENTRNADSDGDLSNGILNGPDAGQSRSEARQARSSDETRKANREPGQVADTDGDKGVDPAQLAHGITSQQAITGTWLWPRGDTSLDGRFTVVVRAGVTPLLFVNGKPVPESQVGERIENRSASAQIVAWYGVTLRAGLNRIEVRGVDSFGNTRILAQKQFKRPAMGSRMVLRARSDTLPADGGRTLLPIDINILDNNNYPAQGVHFVTLSVQGARDNLWVEEDLQSNEPGHQVRVENGRGIAHLRSSEFTGTMVIKAQANDMSAEMRVYQIAALRPLFGNGILELGMQSSRLTGEGRLPTAQADGLDDGTSTYGRLSMFLKGRTRGNAHLTLSYDSDKEEDSELLRDINPNAHYPIHGDASVRGYEAQSRSRLYARLERDRNSLMWGDYLTDANNEFDDLARVQRVLTGFNSQFHGENTRFSLFAARPDDNRGSEEFRGNGTSMLYRLSEAPIVAHSEVVERIVRDRQNPGLVLSTQRLTRFGDYVLDAISGQLSFDNPIAAFDSELNPVYIRVSYDLESGGSSHTVAGVRLQHKIAESLTSGISHTEDRNEENGHALSGAWLEYRPSDKTALSLAMANMRHEQNSESETGGASVSGSGTAQRLSVEHRWGPEDSERKTTLSLARADRQFTNSASGMAAGRQELRLDHRQNLSQRWRIGIEGSHSESLSNEELRSALGLGFGYSADNWSFNGGMRHIRQRSSVDDDRFNTAIAGLERRLRIGSRSGSVNLEYEQDITRQDRNRLGLGVRMQVHEHALLYGQYESQNGIYDFSTPGAGNRTQAFSLGAETDVLPSTRVYSEYRLRGGIGQRDLETGSGIRGTYEISPGITLTPSIEVVDTVSGDDSSDGTAISLRATDARNPNARLTGRAELRNATASDYIGLRLSYAARLNLDWTALLREDFSRQKPNEGQMDMRHAFTAGLARRPRLDNRHHLLFQYTWKIERADGDTADRDVHLLSSHQNLQLGSRLQLSGRIGGKHQSAYLGQQTHISGAWLGDVRASLDLDRRWNLDLRAGLLTTGRGRGRRHSLGAGFSYLLERNLQLLIAYNVVGFREEDLDPDGYAARGIRLGLQYKFDDTAFSWLQNR